MSVIYTYKSTTGKTVNVDNYVITPSGLSTGSPVKGLDSAVGITLSRYTNGVLDVIDTAGSSITAISKNVTVADVDTIIKCTAAVTLTILSDTLGGFNPMETNIIRTYQASAGAAAFAAGSGVTLHGSAKTPAQYVVQQVIRVGANEWTYMD